MIEDNKFTKSHNPYLIYSRLINKPKAGIREATFEDNKKSTQQVDQIVLQDGYYNSTIAEHKMQIGDSSLWISLNYNDSGNQLQLLEQSNVDDKKQKPVSYSDHYTTSNLTNSSLKTGYPSSVSHHFSPKKSDTSVKTKIKQDLRRKISSTVKSVSQPKPKLLKD